MATDDNNYLVAVSDDNYLLAFETASKDRNSNNIFFRLIKACLKTSKLAFSDLENVILFSDVYHSYDEKKDFFISIKSFDLKRKFHKKYLDQRFFLDPKSILAEQFNIKHSLFNLKVFDTHLIPVFYLKNEVAILDSAFLMFYKSNKFYSQLSGHFINEDFQFIYQNTFLSSIENLIHFYLDLFGLSSSYSKLFTISCGGCDLYLSELKKTVIPINSGKFIINPEYYYTTSDLVCSSLVSAAPNTCIYKPTRMFKEKIDSILVQDTLDNNNRKNLVYSFISFIRGLIIDLIKDVKFKTNYQTLALNTNLYGLINKEFILQNSDFTEVYILPENDIEFKDLAISVFKNYPVYIKNA